MSTHTPGPWFANIKAAGAFEITDIPDCWDAVVLCSRYSYEERASEMRANALLMAAAPDLLDALEAMSAHYSGSLDHQPHYVKMGRAAIAKATGEA